VLQSRDLVRLGVGPKKIYLVNHPDLIRQVLEGDSAVFKRQGVEQTTERRLAGESVTTLDGAEHAERWEILEEVFAGAATDRDRERIVACARRLDSSWRDGASVELERQMEALTVDVMGSLASATTGRRSANRRARSSAPRARWRFVPRIRSRRCSGGCPRRSTTASTMRTSPLDRPSTG